LYNISHNKKEHYLEIFSSNKNNYAKIHLDQGASLQELTLNKHTVIKNMSPLSYNKTYASSILFPFANRIENGRYIFNNKTYQLDLNVKEENNAMHGFVYNKTFMVVNKKTDKEFAQVTLEYNEINNTPGFPYLYHIKLDYTLKNSGLDLNVTVTNTDSKAFPYTIGWHPYFTSDNLENSSLEFVSSKKIKTNKNNITTKVEDIETIKSIKTLNKTLDHCWSLDNNNIVFKTPKYNLAINTPHKNNFLQVYTPPKLNTIAIEPTTGVSNSFNNKTGLEILKSNERFAIVWRLKIDK